MLVLITGILYAKYQNEEVYNDMSSERNLATIIVCNTASSRSGIVGHMDWYYTSGLILYSRLNKYLRGRLLTRNKCYTVRYLSLRVQSTELKHRSDNKSVKQSVSGDSRCFNMSCLTYMKFSLNFTLILRFLIRSSEFLNRTTCYNAVSNKTGL